MSTAQRRAREKAERRDSILEAARAVFFEEGFHDATVDDVAAEAEVSKGTIYLYFPSKASLLAHLLLDGLSILRTTLQDAHQTEASLSASQEIYDLAHAYLRFAQEHPNYFRLMMAFDRGRFRESISSELHRDILEQSMRCLQAITQVIERGKEEGEFDVEDTWETGSIIWAALNGVLVLMAHPLRREMVGVELEIVFDDTLDLLLQSLRNKQPAG